MRSPASKIGHQPAIRKVSLSSRPATALPGRHGTPIALNWESLIAMEVIMATLKNLGDQPDLSQPPESVQSPIDPLEIRRGRRLAALKAAEGLWKDRTDIPRDGVEYQNQLRGGWH